MDLLKTDKTSGNTTPPGQSSNVGSFFQPRNLNGTGNPAVQRAPLNNAPNKTPAQNLPDLSKIQHSSQRQIPEGEISRAEFEKYVINNFGVGQVKNGTQHDQEQSLARHNTPTPSISGWQEWGPGAASKYYTYIIQAIEDVALAFTAVPDIKNIVFYKVAYDNVSGTAVARPDVGASFGAGELTVYEAFSGDRAFPVARSIASGKYPDVVISISGEGDTPGAPRPLQPREKSMKENIVHELGHGIAAAAHAADSNIFQKYNASVGWVGGQLFDIGQAAVKSAIAGNTAPPPQFEITPKNWNDPKWIEQPMSHYAVKGGPGEDFAESIAAFIYTKDVLRDRSPERYKFILTGMAAWVAKMQSIPAIQPIGDFPDNPKLQHTA